MLLETSTLSPSKEGIFLVTIFSTNIMLVDFWNLLWSREVLYELAILCDVLQRLATFKVVLFFFSNPLYPTSQLYGYLTLQEVDYSQTVLTMTQLSI